MDQYRQSKSRPNPPVQPEKTTDYEHRTTVNLMSVIAIMLLAAILFWTVHQINESRKLERCVGTGRRDCFVVPGVDPKIIPPPRPSY